MFSKITRTFNSFLKILFISLTIFAVCLGNTSAKVPSFKKFGLVEYPCKTEVVKKDWEKSGLFDYTTEPFTYKKMAKRTAYHEAGHTLIATLLGIRVKSTEILSKKDLFKSNSGMTGATELASLSNNNDLAFLSLFNLDLMYLAGYVAEKIIFKLSSNGFENDLDKANKIILLKKQTFEKFDAKQTMHDLENDSNKASALALLAVIKKNKDLNKKSNVEILKENLSIVTDMTNKNINKLHAIAKALLKKRKLSEKEIANLINNTEN